MITSSGTGIDYAELIERVLEDPDALKLAQKRWAWLADGVLTRNDERAPMTLRVSDAGRCVRELWADLHDKLDIPTSARSRSNMIAGQMDGAWNACCISIGIQLWYPQYSTAIEAEIKGPDGIPGHIDVVVFEGRAWLNLVLEVVECKWQAKAVGIKDPEALKKDSEEHEALYHCIQAAKYAIEKRAPWFVLLYHAPATFSKNGPTRVQFRKETAQWALRVQADYERLWDAAIDAMPEGDPKEGWRCEYCLFSGCPENVNPRKPQPPLLEVLRASVEL